MKSYLSSLDEILLDLSKGKMVVIVDDENRENEGDLVFAAEFVTPEKINFMAKNARGLVCLALDKKKTEKLKLKLMTNENLSRNKTAFTVSIEAKKGITTGISASDRAMTIKTAVAEKAKAEDLVTPGHIFPLVAKEGGVLVRAGHTEASVDLARLAGLKPQGVICEIMNDDGTMARFNDLIKFCKIHDLKMASIKDLITYRLRKERFIKCVQKRKFDSKFAGKFDLHIYANLLDGTQHIVLIKGKINHKDNVLVRMHSFNIFSDFLGVDEEKNESLKKSMKIIQKEKRGVVVILRNPKKELTKFESMVKIQNKNENILKEYGIGAQILLEIGIKNIILLSNTEKNIVGIDGFGLIIRSVRKI